MFDIQNTLKEFGLTEDKYEQLLDDCSKKANKESDMDWSEIAEKYNLNWNGDSLRKGNISLVGGSFVKQYYEEKYTRSNQIDGDEYLQKLSEKKREIEMLKVQYRDERNAWSKQNYNAARNDTNFLILENELKSIGKINFKEHILPNREGSKTMIVCLSDLHIGQTFDSMFGSYNSDIAKDRLSQYLGKIKEVAGVHKVSNVYVFGLGDQISGSIHKTIAITNRENVIEQIKIATELISSFCYELTENFNNVYYCDVVGNHSRLDTKDNALHNERLDNIIGWGVSLCLNHIENFHYLKHRNVDVGIADVNICGKTYLAVHGDYDSMSKQGVSNLSAMLGVFPYCILRGHMHFPAYSEFNGVKVIQSGSLAGCGDDYTIEKRLNGKPSQTLLICDDNGIDAIYNVELH